MFASDHERNPGRGKSTLLCVAWAALALCLASCGGDEPAPASTSAPVTTAPTAPVATTAAPETATPVDPAATATEPAATDAANAAMAALSIPDLLKAANQAVDEQRLVAPPGNNAIEYYLAVTEREPNNMQATQALVDIFPMIATVAEREIAQRRVDEAERIVSLLDKASPGSYTVTTIRTKLDTARAQVLREQEQQLAAQQARQQAADAAAAQAAANPPAPTTAPPAATASRPATPAQTTPAPQPSAPVASTEPAATAAPPPSGGETRGARPLRQIQPEYPIEAARKRQEGWVELEFTIGTDGRVSEVTVLRAQPARVFNREATRAMQQWTFEPALEDGQAIVSRERRRIEFQL